MSVNIYMNTCTNCSTRFISVGRRSQGICVQCGTIQREQRKPKKPTQEEIESHLKAISIWEEN